jgi:hypothetical protein
MVVCRLVKHLAIKEEVSQQTVTKTKCAQSAIPRANNVLMKEMLEIDHDAGNVPITAGTFTLPLEDVPVHVKMVFMNHPDSPALHVLSPAINALEVRLLAQIALKIADSHSCILKHA